MRRWWSGKRGSTFLEAAALPGPRLRTIGVLGSDEFPVDAPAGFSPRRVHVLRQKEDIFSLTFQELHGVVRTHHVDDQLTDERKKACRVHGTDGIRRDPVLGNCRRKPLPLPGMQGVQLQSFCAVQRLVGVRRRGHEPSGVHNCRSPAGDGYDLGVIGQAGECRPKLGTPKLGTPNLGRSHLLVVWQPTRPPWLPVMQRVQRQ